MNPTDTSLAALLLALLPQTASWKRIEPGLALAFPADHGAHPQYRTEWWYLTGHLEDADGARFGFQFTIFRRGLDPREPSEGELALRAKELYAGHLALTDVARGETRFAERLRSSSPLARASGSELDLALEDWALVRDEHDQLKLVASDPGKAFGFEFTLRPQKPLVLHGQGGYSQKGDEPGNASAYVSWTRLALEGTLALDGGARAVRGSAWYDHEFGSSVLPEGVAGWDWFALQLEDGRELMVFGLRERSGGQSKSTSATVVARDGTTRTLKPAEFTLRSTGTWTSTKSRGKYPAGWTLAVPSEGLELVLTPLVADCELDSRSTRVTYWEGPIDVRGSAAGRGYAELTGYAGTLGGKF